jgi:peptide deformylase
MFEDLKIISWPDPRLLKQSLPVEVFNDDLLALALRMRELMREAKGVGLAAPQVGHNIRLFVIGPTGNPEDERVYVNPVLSDLAGDQEGEEGCLSLPGITARIVRADSARIDARDLEGRPIQDLRDQYIARIWQHELDHLDGRLLMDRMGIAARLGSRKKLKDLEAEYQKAQGSKAPAALKLFQR